jgi:hypothetical protein
MKVTQPDLTIVAGDTAKIDLVFSPVPEPTTKLFELILTREDSEVGLAIQRIGIVVNYC